MYTEWAAICNDSFHLEEWSLSRIRKRTAFINHLNKISTRKSFNEYLHPLAFNYATN